MSKTYKIVSKLVDSSLALLNMKLDSDGEYKFFDRIRTKFNFENGFDADIPAYLQLFWTINENGIKLNDKM